MPHRHSNNIKIAQKFISLADTNKGDFIASLQRQIIILKA
jgi:hypothetical protein